MKTNGRNDGKMVYGGRNSSPDAAGLGRNRPVNVPKGANKPAPSNRRPAAPVKPPKPPQSPGQQKN